MMRCTKTYKGWRSKCHTRLEEFFNHLGAISYRCPRCALVDRGRCWKCAKIREKKLSAFCDECIKERARKNRKNYAKTEKGKIAIKKYTDREDVKEKLRVKARDRYVKDKLKIINKLGYNTSPPVEYRPHKSGWKVVRD